MSGVLVQRLAELNLIKDPASAGTKTLVISRHRKQSRRHQVLGNGEVIFPFSNADEGANEQPCRRLNSHKSKENEELYDRAKVRRDSLQKFSEYPSSERISSCAPLVSSVRKPAPVNCFAKNTPILSRRSSATPSVAPVSTSVHFTPEGSFDISTLLSDANETEKCSINGVMNQFDLLVNDLNKSRKLDRNENEILGRVTLISADATLSVDECDHLERRKTEAESHSHSSLLSFDMISEVSASNNNGGSSETSDLDPCPRLLDLDVDAPSGSCIQESSGFAGDASRRAVRCGAQEEPNDAFQKCCKHLSSSSENIKPPIEIPVAEEVSLARKKPCKSKKRSKRSVKSDSKLSKREYLGDQTNASVSRCTETLPVVEGDSNFPCGDAADELLPALEDHQVQDDGDTDQETDRLLGQQRADDPGYGAPEKEKESTKKKGRSKEVVVHEPAVLIEGVLFRARYLGSTQLVSEGQPTKTTRMMQAEEAVTRIKAPDGENQPNTEVDLFISTEKIMVLNTDLKEIMMDHALRTISYIADIGDLVVLMARRRMLPTDDPNSLQKQPKMICHVFESDEAQFIAQSIGQAFQVAYLEFLKANGIEDHSFVKEMDYQEVLNSQEIFGDELQMFAKKELQKEVVVPKMKSEILGVVVVESGWGSMVPTVVIANLSPYGAAAKCGQLNIGDQIIAINGVSLVGLPLSTCQNYIKNTKYNTAVKLTVVPCPPVVEVKIRRPDTKYQLGFSVQNGVICSLLRGGIAERGGVRVGHRIIDINSQSVVAVPHEKIVNLLATSVGEIRMKTMPTSIFRLLTGQETPQYI